MTEVLREKYIDFNNLFNKMSGTVSKDKHIISDREWYKCREYFDFSCAYCGMTQDLHMTLFNASLSREHVENLGSNYIDNCVPSCKRCNTSKGRKDFMEWYKTSENFDEDKLNKIVLWLEEYHLYV